jgi:hypothetical protein
MPIDGGTMIGVALIILLIFLLVRGHRRRHRIFRRAGFAALPLEGNELVRVAEIMTGLPAMDIHRGEQDGRPLFIVELDSGSSDDPNLTMLLYEAPTADRQAAAAFQTSANLPRLLKRLSGGFFARMEPLPEETGAPLGKGWNLFAEGGAIKDDVLVRQLAASTRIPEGPYLLAIAVDGPYIALWGSRFYLRHLVAAGPKVAAAFADSAT